MQCPFLKKIHFKKVKQIVSEDYHSEQLRNQTTNIFHAEEDFDLIEQTIENINPCEVQNRHQVYYFNTKINIPEKSNQTLEIKFPKQFEAKKMIIEESWQDFESEEDVRFPLGEHNSNEDIISELQIGQMKNTPHILISKMSLLNTKCQDIFYAQITLDQQKNYTCQIKEQVIKITKSNKIKYYIQLRKIKYHYEKDKCKDSKTIILDARCKAYEIKLRIGFDHQKKVIHFCKVMDVVGAQIKEELEMDERIFNQSLNSDYSLDSLIFQTERMDINKLFQVADTFDLILFKNKNFMSKFQRFLTNSDYDHVAMILKTHDNQHFILESTSNSGVAVYSLKGLIDLPRKKYYNRIGFRKYNGQRSNSDLAKLQAFIREAIGKKYKFDPMYLISSQVQKEDTYFCSELVSQALQRSGFQNKSKPSYKYLPKHFSDDSINQNIIKGSYLDIIIIQ